MASRIASRNGKASEDTNVPAHDLGHVASPGTDYDARAAAAEARRQSEEVPSEPSSTLPGLPTPLEARGGAKLLAERALSLRSALVPPGGEWESWHPTLYEAVCPAKDAKGRKIEGLSFTFAADGDSYRVYVNWPLGGVRTTVTFTDPLTLWEILDGLLTGKIKASWKEQRRTPRHLQKSE